MRSRTRFSLLSVAMAVAAFSLYACEPQDQEIDVNTQAEPEQTEMESPAAAPTSTMLTGELSASGDLPLGGSVDVTSTATGASASVTLTQGEAGSEYPWHIHEGTCDSGAQGPIVGDASAYTPLRPDETGQARATAELSVPLSAMGSYYVNVHASPDDLGTIVACGELSQ